MTETPTHPAPASAPPTALRLDRPGATPARLRAVIRPPSAREWLLLALFILLLSFAASLKYLAPDDHGREVDFDELTRLAETGTIERATFLDEDARIVGETARGAESREFWVAYPSSDSATGVLLQTLTTSGAQVSVDAQPAKGAVRVVATGLLPLMILAAVFGLFFVGSAPGRGGEIRGFGTMSRRGGGLAAPPDARFSDIAGADEAVTELREVVEYLNDPARYAALGASPPKGVLLFGPPGTGKTLIARATAGEAGVPFFSVAGAEFVESLVGVGAARIRDLFARVGAVAPAIVFIDELDAAGRRRGGADTGGSEEREQTLNQLLVELDGFAASTGVVVMGATNRPDILDPALLRPGRFDRHVTVDAPDIAGREKILALHTRAKPLADDVDLHLLARRTPGFTGADLANVVNEAALLTIRGTRTTIGMHEITEAVDRVLGGPQRQGRILGWETRQRIATHEVGHAILATMLGEEVHRISAVSRGRGLGSVGFGAGEDAVLLSSSDLFDRIVVTISGLAAEELVFGTLSTGGESDLERATGIARDMVTRFGMSAAVGRVRLVGAAADMFLGGAASLSGVSESLRERVEVETSRLLDDAFEIAKSVLDSHRWLLDAMVDQLMADEVLEGEPLLEYLGAVNGAEKVRE